MQHRTQELSPPEFVCEQVDIILEPDESCRRIPLSLIKAEAHRVEQGTRHKDQVHKQGGKKKQHPGDLAAVLIPKETRTTAC